MNGAFAGEAPGWTREAVAERLAEAADTLRRLPDPARGPRGHANSWPPIVRLTAESYAVAAEDAPRRRIPPSPAQIDRLEEALRWLAWLDGDLQKLVWLRAVGIPWWKLELRAWLLHRQRRRYERTTLAAYWVRGVGLILRRLNEEGRVLGRPARARA